MAFYQLRKLERVGAADIDGKEQRPAVRGEQMELGFYRYPPGTRKPPHRHPEEQIVAVLKGKLFLGVATMLGPVVGLVAAVRLAKPGSPWARRRSGAACPATAAASSRSNAN